MVGGSCQNPAMSHPMRRFLPITMSGVVIFANVEQDSRLNILTVCRYVSSVEWEEE